MEENNYLVESFSNSIGSDIVELTGEAVEFTLDVCSGEDSILKEVPFVGTAVKLYSIGSKVHDKHNFYKLKSFIKAVNTGSGKAEELEERRERFLSNAKFRKQELEYLLILIERYVGFAKPNMLGKLYIAYIDGIIDWNELTMYAEVVDRFLPGDYDVLQNSDSPKMSVSDDIVDSALRLMAMGLIRQNTGMDVTDDGDGNVALINAEGYWITSFGIKLKEIIGR